MSDKFAIETRDLTKTYDGTTVVDHLNFFVRENEVFGLLGPNGAGKTTTILMMLGLTEPASGTVKVFDYNPTREPLQVKRIVGYLPEEVGFYDNLTARENLRFIADLNKIPPAETERRIDNVLEMVGLADARDMITAKYSRGMRQRLGIADVLIKEPKLVILDEPTSGLDPSGINHLLDIICGLPKMGTTVLLSSHQLYQVQRVCHSVGILSKGKLVIEGSIAELGREALAGGRYIIEVETAQPRPELVNTLGKIKGVDKVEIKDNILTISTGADLRSQIAKAVVDSDALLVQMKVHEFSLDDIYMKYFKER
ncbi:MAG TPA: ABC transporter ATP-binding protein [Dehalococcoidales bacterium]|nr:MAG: ABC transporter ATP-binding protein [Chloroflexi bacterium RBG_16_60_22]HJX13437.1 ABC transporter ATP-binding protein [Dehalococcoidales bacterium]